MLLTFITVMHFSDIKTKLSDKMVQATATFVCLVLLVINKGKASMQESYYCLIECLILCKAKLAASAPLFSFHGTCILLWQVPYTITRCNYKPLRCA